VDAMAAVGEVANWRFVFSHQSYFESFGRPPLLRHLWSLGIEEQFYLVWPPIFVLLASRLGARRSAIVTAAGVLISWALMALVFNASVDPSRAYYGTDTRLGGLLVGATLALVWAPWQKSVDRRPIGGVSSLEFGGLAAFLVLFLCLTGLSDANPFLYLGGFAIVDLAAALVIAATVDPGAVLLPWVLDSRVMRWVGVRSYGIYLWHWPISMVTRPGVDIPLYGFPLFVFRVGLTLGIAALSYRFVEQPIRTRGYGWLCARVKKALASPAWRPRAAASASLTGVGLLLGATIAASGPARPSFPVPAFSGVVAAARSGPSEAPLAPQEPAANVRVEPIAEATEALPSQATSTPEPYVRAPAPSTERPVATPTTAETPVPVVQPVSSSSSAPTTPATPSPAPAPEHVDVLALGDSVMLGAYGTLGQLGTVQVDAAVGRQPYAVAGILAAIARRGEFPPAVVIHVGNNGVFGGALTEMLESLTGVKRVVLVSLKVDQPWEEGNNAEIVAAAARYPNVRVADWHAVAAAHPEILYGDGLHVRPEWAWAYADVIGGALHAP